MDGNALPHGFGSVARTTVVERIHISDAGFVASIAATRCSGQQVADQVAVRIGSGFVFVDGAEGWHAVNQHRRVVDRGDGDAEGGAGLKGCTADVALVVDGQVEGVGTAVVEARCVGEGGNGGVEGGASAFNGHAGAGIGPGGDGDAGGVGQGKGAVGNTQGDTHHVVCGVAVVAVNDVDIAEADPGDTDGSILGNGLGSWLGNGGGVVDVADGDGNRVTVGGEGGGGATGAYIYLVACSSGGLIPGVVVKAGGLAVFGVRHEADHVGACQQQGAGAGNCADVRPASGTHLVLPLAAG